MPYRISTLYRVFAFLLAAAVASLSAYSATSSPTGTTVAFGAAKSHPTLTFLVPEREARLAVSWSARERPPWFNVAGPEIASPWRKFRIMRVDFHPTVPAPLPGESRIGTVELRI